MSVERLYAVKNLDELRDEYDRIAKAYEHSVVEEFGWKGHERIAAIAARLLPRTAVVMDAGAGSGLVGVALAGHGFTTIDALDLSADMLAEARRKGIYRDLRQRALGGPLDYPSDTYDGIVVAGVFTPGHAPPGSLDELVRIAKPGGTIIFSLRDDVVPAGFPEKFAELGAAGLWQLAECTEPWQSMPIGEPEVHHRIWVFRVR